MAQREASKARMRTSSRLLLVALAVLATALTLAHVSVGATEISRPRIASKSFELQGSRPGPNYTVTVVAKLTVCDESAGPLTALVKERKFVGDDELGARSFTRTIWAAKGGCNRHVLRWRLGDEFFGVGWYTVNIRIRDNAGAVSKPAGRAWFTGD